MSISAPRRPSPIASDPKGRTSYASAHNPSERRTFPGWRWMAVWPAFPLAGYIGWKVGGRVDAVDAALVGGAITAAGLAAAQWWAAKGQGLMLARQGRRALALPWALAMPVVFTLGWSVASVTGIGVDDQFTVFGAGGALLSGLLLARLTPARAPGA